MSNYTEILSQIQTLNKTEKISLFEELKKQLYSPFDDEFLEEELAESEWRLRVSDYRVLYIDDITKNTYVVTAIKSRGDVYK